MNLHKYTSKIVKLVANEVQQMDQKVHVIHAFEQWRFWSCGQCAQIRSHNFGFTLLDTYIMTVNEFRCYEAKIEESRKKRKKKTAATRSWTRNTSGLSCQCSATEPQQPENHQPSQSSICTAQVLLNASVTHLAAMHSACAVRTPLGVDWKILSIRCAT